MWSENEHQSNRKQQWETLPDFPNGMFTIYEEFSNSELTNGQNYSKK